MPHSTSVITALAAAVVLAASGACGSPQAQPTAVNATPASTDRSSTLSFTDGWAKAGKGMTGAFGTLTNATDSPITVSTASSDVAARTELHTMAKQPDGSMKMVRKEGGFVVPARGSARLVPGGDHIMLIGLTKELQNGDQVRITLTSADGQTFAWSVPVRSFAGAEETYLPGATSTGMAH